MGPSVTRAALFLAVSCLAAARTVEHRFVVSYFEVDPDGSGYTYVRGINGMLPGPEIRVRVGDRLKVHVENRLQTEAVSLHWHGFEMRGSWHYDGAVGITQCGIAPGENFTYDFVVEEHPGSYQYHEHAQMAHVGARGLFGPLVVEPREGESEPWPYAHDKHILLSEWWPDSAHALEMQKWAGLTRGPSVSKDFNSVGLLGFHSLLINGLGAYAAATQESPQPGWVTPEKRVSELFELVSKAGETWRLRVQNAGALYAMRFRIDGHRLTVVQADGADVDPLTVDALSMSSGERFDVLVTFAAPGSYWMRVETLEANFGVQHAQLGVLRYEGQPEGQLPESGFPLRHDFFSAPGLTTLNCVDQGPISPTCLPITVLRARARVGHSHPPPQVADGQAPHDFEVSFRGFTKPDDAHFTRVLDLGRGGKNELGQDQFAGDYVQFVPPSLPYSHVNGSRRGEFANTLRMKVERGEVVRVVLQIQDRTAHPWHLHGHKFAVLGSWMPNYGKDCDILFCRSQQNAWITRDGFPKLLDPAVAPLKDTVHVPPGGWVVIQFVADNPGWWFFHCHMLIHHHDGMAVVVEEDKANMPAIYTDAGALGTKGFPSCRRQLADLQRREQSVRPGGVSCPCWQDPEKFFGNELLSGYRCSHSYLCGQLIHSKLDPPQEARLGARRRAEGWPWRVAYTAGLLLAVLLLFLLKWLDLSMRRRYARQLFELGTVAREADGLMATRARRYSAHSAASEAAVKTRRSRVDSVGSVESPLPPPRRSVRSAAEGSELAVPVPMPRNSQYSRGGSGELSIFGNRRTGGSGSIMAHLTVLNLPQVRMPVSWRATCRTLPRTSSHLSKDSGKPKQCEVSGDLLPGMVMAVVGSSTDTMPWLRLFRGQRQEGEVQVSGQVILAGVDIRDWQRQELHRACGLVGTGEQLLRPGSTVTDVVAFTLHMLRSTNYAWEVQGERSMKLARVLMAFDLLADADRLVADLPPAKYRRAVAAGSMAVPRGLIILEEPLNGLDPQEAERTLKLFSALAMMTGTILVFSATSLSMDQQRHVTKALLCRQEGVEVVVQDPYFSPLEDRDTFVDFDWSIGSYLQRLFVLIKVELLHSFFHEHLTQYQLMEAAGVGLCAGLVWLHCNTVDTQVALTETVGLLFYTTAVWTIPPAFQALATTPALVARASHDVLNGTYTVPMFVLAIFICNFLLAFVWVALWQCFAYTLSDVGKDLPRLLLMHLVMVLNVLSMRGVGMVLGILAPGAAVSAVVCNIIAQVQMLTNGFYTKLHPGLHWIVELSIPRLAFRALQKLEYSWKDTFEVHPMSGIAGVGFPTRFLPAELTGFFGLMRDRGMEIMQSPEPDDYALPEVFRLFATALLCFGLFATALHWHVKARETPASREAMPARARRLSQASVASDTSRNSPRSPTRPQSQSPHRTPRTSVCDMEAGRRAASAPEAGDCGVNSGSCPIPGFRDAGRDGRDDWERISASSFRI